MSQEIASAYVRIRPNMAGFRSETEAGVKSAFSGVGKIIGVALTATAAFDFGKSIIEDAASVQKSVETIKAEFGPAGDAVVDFGKKGATALGISANLADATSARFGILFKNLGIGQDEAAGMTVGFEKLAGSIAAIRGIDPATVLANLPLAAAGNLRSLKQLGIAVDANTLKLAAYKLGLIQTTTQALTPAQRAEAIYAIATGRLGDYLDQAKAHAGDAANVQRRLSAEWQNAKEELGAGLLPEVAHLGSVLGKDLPGAIETVKTDFVDVKNVVEEVSKPFGGVTNAVKGLVAAWATFKIASIATAIRNDLVAKGTAILEKSSVAAAGGVAKETAAADAAIGPNTAAATATNDLAAANERLNLATGTNTLALKTQGVANAAGQAEKAAVAEEGAATTANAAAVGLLGTLKSLAAVGVITIGIELIVNRKGLASWFDKNLPGARSVDKFVTDNVPGARGLFDTIFGKKEVNQLVGAPKAISQKDIDDLVKKASGGGLAQELLRHVEEEAAKGKGFGGVSNDKLKNLLFNAGAISAISQAGDAYETTAKEAFGRNVGKVQDAVSTDIQNGVGGGTQDGTAKAIALAKQNLADLQQQLDAAIQQRTLDIQQSVNSAKQNLQTIGGTLAQSIGAVLDQPLTNLQNKLTAYQNNLTLENLRRTVLLPGGKSLSKDPEKAIAELKALAAKATDATRPAIEGFLVQYQQAALAVQQDQVNRQKIVATRGIADLTDLYNKHQITAKQLQAGVYRILGADGVSFKKAGTLLGVSFEDGFKAQIKGLLDQAAAIAASPQLAGSGQEPNIVRPFLEIQKENRDIARQTLTIAKKRLALDEKIAKYSQQTADQTKGLVLGKLPGSSDKNPGTASDKTKKLVGAH